MPTSRAPDRFMVGSTSLLTMRPVSLPAANPRAKSLFRSDARPREEGG